MKSEIKEYLEGTLPEEEAERLSEQLITAKLNRDKKRNWEQQLAKKYGVRRNAKVNPWYWKIEGQMLLGLVASLCLVLSCLFWLIPATKGNYLSLVDQHLKELQIMSHPSVLRKGTANYNQLREKATLAYVSRDYDQSIPIWKQLEVAGVADKWDYFYFGLCYLQQSPPNYLLGIRYLEKSVALDGPADELHWILALAYLQNGSVDRGLQQLDQLIERGNYQIQAATELRQRIRQE
ncbi:MAG: hypothetical protein AAF985_11910 [Bacteroidota bacterium]